MRAGYALQFWIATQLARRGNRWYDLGGDGGNAGLTQFKKGFVGKAGAMPDIGADHSLCTDPVSRLAGYAFEQVQAWRERRHLRANA